MSNSKKGMKMLIHVKWKKGCSSATTGSIIHLHFILTWDWELTFVLDFSIARKSELKHCEVKETMLFLPPTSEQNRASTVWKATFNYLMPQRFLFQFYKYILAIAKKKTYSINN